MVKSSCGVGTCFLPSLSHGSENQIWEARKVKCIRKTRKKIGANGPYGKGKGEVGVELEATGMVVKYFARTPHTQLAIGTCLNGLIKML